MVARWIEPRKITHYLLNPGHPNGSAKCALFRSFGFDPVNPAVLEFALLDHFDRYFDESNPALFAKGHYGLKAVLDGRNPRARSVWLLDDASWLLVTAYIR
jgi:transposase InsO family protein